MFLGRLVWDQIAVSGRDCIPFLKVVHTAPRPHGLRRGIVKRMIMTHPGVFISAIGPHPRLQFKSMFAIHVPKPCTARPLHTLECGGNRKAMPLIITKRHTANPHTFDGFTVVCTNGWYSWPELWSRRQCPRNARSDAHAH